MNRFVIARRLASLTVATLVALALPVGVHAQALGQLYASVVDADGQPILDLTGDDFGLSIDGTDLTVVSATVDSEPYKVALMVDNGNSIAESNGDVALREGLEAFVTTLDAQHEIGVFTIARNVQRRTDFTTDREELLDSVGGVFSDRGAGVRMMEGLFETWERRFEDEDSWPVFVMVLTDGGELSGYISDDDYADFVNDLVARGGTIHIVLFSSQGSNSQTGGAQLQYGLNLTQNTGGLFETINAATGLGNILTQYATQMNDHFDQVSTRYRVVYEIPDSVSGGGISVTIDRPDATLALFADRRMPQ